MIQAQPLVGATFELYRDNGGTPNVLDATDTLVDTQGPTGANGRVSFTNVLPGVQYIVHESITPAGHETAADQLITPAAGDQDAAVELTFVDVRKFTIIVLVCKESNNTLYPSTVTVDGADKTSLATGGGGTITDAQLCALGGASYSGKHTGNHPGNVNIPV